ncbi:MAG: CHAD domain-containing protein [Candidatus Cybelea sp.]
MKPHRVDLHGVDDVQKLVARVLQTRLREARALTTRLARRDQQGLHDFRIAGKRLRYALERFQALDPSLEAIAQRLALVQDALGEAHDRDVLLAILPPTMPSTQRRLKDEREAFVDRSLALWSELEQLMQALDSHPI